MAEDGDWVVLVCPPGAADAPISEGDKAYWAYREDHLNEHSRWLVRVPRNVARHLCWNAGFYVLSENSPGG
jgi:hypothetical protein